MLKSRWTIREETVELAGDDSLIFLDPPEQFDECIVGIANRCGMDTVVAYDQNKVIESLAKEFAEGSEDDGMTNALEWFHFNTVGAYIGDKTPVFITLLEPE